MNPIELTAQRALLKYAVQRAIFNRDGSIADIRRSVLVQVSSTDQDPAKEATQLFAGADFDASVVPLFGQMHASAVVEVWDGRILNSRRANRDAGHYLVPGRP